VSEREIPLWQLMGTAKIVVAPPNIDISPHVSIAMPKSPMVSYFAMSRAMQAVQDVAMKLMVARNIQAISEHIPAMLSHNFGVAAAQKAAGPTGDAAALREALINDYQGLFDNWEAGVGHGVGTSYSSAMEQFLSTGQLLYPYKTLMYQIAITPRMHRRWNKMFTPTVPNTQMAYSLMLRGKIDEKQFATYAGYDGWPQESISDLKAVWEAVPNVAAAWRFLKRGAISDTDFKNYVRMSAWPDGWADRFMTYYEPLPTMAQAAHMVLRGSMTPMDYVRNALKLGYDPATATRMLVNWLGYPTTREAFYMHRRGIVDERTRNSIYQTHGYLSDWWPLISENYEHIPNPLNAFKMMMRGTISRKDFDTYIYQNGWLPEFAAKFYALHENTPTSHEAYFMWKKGLISVAARNELYRAYGWDPRFWALITKNYEYVPTLYDLFRLADYVEVDPIWATDVMKRRGLADADIAKLLPMIKIRPLRDEVKRQIAIWVNRYKLGWCSATQLEAALDAMLAAKYIQVTEKTLITEEAELEFEDELITESIRILMWKFRMGAITEEAYLEDLLALGIRREKANLMVEEQKAMGYYGYAY